MANERSNEPVANQFREQDRERTGNAVNARTGEMGEALDDNADALEDTYADKGRTQGGSPGKA